MTTIRFFRSGGRLTGFACRGHSGFAEAGEDIVCAAVTSAVRLAECTIDDVLMAGADVLVDEAGACITVTLPRNCPNADGCRAVLGGLLLYLKELSIENPEHISVLEV